MFILRSSKTHDKQSKPQIVKISSTKTMRKNKMDKSKKLELPCSYKSLRSFVNLRKNCTEDQEQFFVFADGLPVTASHMRRCLKQGLKNAGFNQTLYSVHSLRAGRAGTF